MLETLIKFHNLEIENHNANFKFESDIFNAVYRMTLKSIEDYET